jgi:hypothetical protein
MKKPIDERTKQDLARQDVRRLFDAYCEASRAAQASLKIEDGISAGHAWAAFLAAFLPEARAA